MPIPGYREESGVRARRLLTVCLLCLTGLTAETGASQAQESPGPPARAEIRETTGDNDSRAAAAARTAPEIRAPEAPKGPSAREDERLDARRGERRGVTMEEEQAAATQEGKAVRTLSVRIVPPGKDPARFLRMATDLILVKEGEPLDPFRLLGSLRNLRLCGEFQKVELEILEHGQEIELEFLLRPSHRIKQVDVKGAFPFFAEDIQNQMSLRVGDAFDQTELEKQSQQLRNYYGREGYPDPKITITAEKDPDDDLYVIRVQLEEGQWCRVESLEIEGNLAFSDRRLKLMTSTWRRSRVPGSTGRFRESILAKDVEGLTRFYWKNGYPEAAVRSEVTGGAGATIARILITIEEGPRYNISFSGEESLFGKHRLRKDLVLSAKGNRRNTGIRRSMKNMVERYRQAGYQEADVTLEDRTETVEGQQVRNLRFVVEKGPRSIVDSIEIDGNQAFPDRKIRKQMLTQEKGLFGGGGFVPVTLEEDLVAVKAMYLGEGFPDTAVTQETSEKPEDDEKLVSIRLKVEEGPRTMVSSVEVTGPDGRPPAALSGKEIARAVLLREGQPFRNFMLEGDQNRLATRISEKGYPHAKATGEVTVSEDKTDAAVTYRTEQGPKVNMGEVYPSGNLRTRKRVFTRQVDMKPGEPFSLKQMLEGQRNIRNLEIFDQVKFKTFGLEERADTVTLFVEVREKRPYYIELGGGYETRRGFFAHSSTGDRNLFGRNQSVWAAGEVSQIGYRGEGGISDPNLFGSGITATFRPFAERRAEFNWGFGIKSYGASLVYSRRWRQRLDTTLDLSYERRYTFLKEAESSSVSVPVLDPSELEPRNVVLVTPAVTYQGQDSVVRPRKGIFSFFSVTYARGLGDSPDNFLKYWLELRYYLTPISRLTLAWRANAGYIQPLAGADFVPTDQLFYLGGSLDLRGFRENLFLYDENDNAVGGRTALSGSVEARIDLTKNIEFDLFFDAGRLSDTYVEGVGDRLGYSAGPGLRYHTPIGPVGVLYGINLSRRSDEPFGNVHFAIGYTF